MALNTLVKEDFEALIDSDYIDWSEFEHASIFITGATGQIGSLLTKLFLYYRKSRGTDTNIIIFARNEEKVNALFGDAVGEDYFSVVYGDIVDQIILSKDVDYIFHCASVTTSKFMVEHPVELIRIGVFGTENVMELARAKQVKKVVYFSSMEAFGQTREEDNPITEEKLGYIDCLSVRSSYSEGKRMCECLCASYAKEYGVPVTIARLGLIFGAGVSRNESRVFASFARSVLAGEDIVLHTAGNSVGNYCYTKDALGGLLCLALKGKVSEAYTIVNENTVMRVKEMAQVVIDAVGSGKEKLTFDIPEDALTFGYAPDTNMRLSSAKLRGLGWKPTVDLKEMYQRMCKSWE